MLDPKAAIESIYKIAKVIYDQVQLVRANHAQFGRLLSRIKIIEEAVHGLEFIKDQGNYQKALNDLLTNLQNCLEFIKEFSESSRWFRWVLKAGTYKEKFETLNNALYTSMQQLNLGLTAQQIVNHEKDKEDQEKDYHFILSKQDEIIRLNQEANFHIQKLDFQQHENQVILLRQLESIRAQLNVLNVNKKAPAALIDPHFTVFYYELMFDKKIGAGSLGQVYVGRWNEQVVAIKSLEGNFLEDEKEEFIREIKIMSQLRNNHITQFYGACVEPQRACLLMEYMENGSLYELLGKNKLSPTQQKQMALDLARGLHYLHSQQILHRDLKSTNILIDVNGKAKISNFGLSKIKSNSIETIKKYNKTIKWLAPECFKRGSEYTAQSDIYSFGVILWEIVTGKKPYASLTEENIVHSILNGYREEIPSTTPEVYAKVINACWHQDPARRLALTNIIHTLEAYMPRSQSPTPKDYYNKGIEFERAKQYSEAYQSYKKSADKGYIKADTNLGLFYLMGKGGIQQNKKEAHRHFLKAAQKKHMRAMYNLAVMLEKGDGIEKNLGEALKWYQEAYNNGDTQALKKCQELQSILNTEQNYRDFDASERSIA